MGWRNLGFSSYQDYLNNFLWKEKVKLMIEHYKECSFCGSRRNLQVHHTKEGYYRIPQERCQDLLVVCKDCHKKIHKKEENGRKN